MKGFLTYFFIAKTIQFIGSETHCVIANYCSGITITPTVAVKRVNKNLVKNYYKRVKNIDESVDNYRCLAGFVKV